MRGYEQLMEDILAAIPDEIDKREGSLIFTAIAPIASMISGQQWYADNIMDATMADTARGDDLTRKCAEHGVNRYPASSAVRKAVFTTQDGERQDVQLETRFGAEGITYLVTKRLELGVYELTCEQTGKAGNLYFGPILPINNPYLGAATLSDVLIPGEEIESDDALRERFYIVVNSRPFGGNIDQYKEYIRAIPGIGDVKVFPTPEGQGGKVQCVIIDADNRPASPTLVAKVQEIINPEPSGKGYGLAPIGHDTTVSTVEELAVDVETSVAVRPDYTVHDLEPVIRQQIERYLQSLVFVDDVVRVARLDAAVLEIDGIADIRGTTINGQAGNLLLSARWDKYEVPKMGSLTVVGMSDV